MPGQIRLKGNERILVVRTDRIGDLILATPVFQALKDKYPDLEVDALVGSLASPVLEHNPHINNVLIYDTGNLKALRTAIRQRGYDLAIFVYPRWQTTWLSISSGIPIRIGTAYRFYSFLYTHRLRQHRKLCRKHEVEYNLELLSALGIVQNWLEPKVYLSNNEREYAEKLLRDQNVESKALKILIHPGGGRSSPRWGIDRFAELAHYLNEHLGAKIILTGLASERYLTNSVARRLGKGSVNLAGELSLRQLAAVLSHADAVVANSTGPLHLAAAVGTRVVGLYSPIKTATPVRWGPYGIGHHALMPPFEACSCSVSRCKEGTCMDSIPARDVVSKLEIIMGNRIAERK